MTDVTDNPVQETTTDANGSAGPSPQGQPASNEGHDSWLDALPGEARSEILKLRGESARYRTERNDARGKAQQLEDAKKTQEQLIREQNERLASENAELKLAQSRSEVAAKYGLTLKQAQRLRGSSIEEIDADGADYAAEIGEQDRSLQGDQQQGRREWGQGARGTKPGSGGAAGMNDAIRARMGA